MATSWGKIGGASALIQKMEATEAASVAAKTKLAAAEAKFKQQHGSTPADYLLAARLAAYATTSAAQGLQGRSRAGAKHTNEAPQSKVMKGAIKEYHDLEEQGKACARSGDIPGAITKYSEAANKRVAYEKETGKAPDAGHAHRVLVLRERRRSLVGLKNDLDSASQEVVDAKLVISNFFAAEGVPYTI
jgi:hypothetical protein